MIWKAKVEPLPTEGDLKIEKRFAWWPKQIGDKTIWLESYTILYEFVIRERALPYIRGMDKIIYLELGGWDKVGERINRGMPRMENPPPPPNSNEEDIRRWKTFVKHEEKNRYQ